MLHPIDATMTPHEKVTRATPDISDLRPFGALVYYHLSEAERDMSTDPRWKAKALKGVLLGLAPNVKGGYIIYPGGLRKPIVRKHVLVLEAKETLVLPVYSDRFLIGDTLSPRELTIPQADQRDADAPTPRMTRSSTRESEANESQRVRRPPRLRA
jgi:hypothetical protein